MSVETGTDDGAVEERADELARKLGEAVSALPEYEAFEAAKAAVEADEELQERIREFERLREEFVLARQSGEVDDGDVARVKRAQRELHGHPVMAEYLDAKETLEDRLGGLNEAISEPLVVDFGGEAGGCCQE